MRPIFIGLIVTFALLASAMIYFRPSLNNREPIVPKGEAISVATTDHEKLMSDGTAEEIHAYLVELNAWPRSATLPSRVEFQRRRITTANRLIELKPPSEFEFDAIRSRISAAEALYGLNFVNDLNQPALAKLMENYSLPFVNHENPSIARSARLAMVKLRVFEHAEFVKATNIGIGDPLLSNDADTTARNATRAKLHERIEKAITQTLARYPNDIDAIETMRPLLARLNSDDALEAMRLMKLIHQQFKDHESVALSRFAREVYDKAVLREHAYPKMIADRWVNGATSRVNILQTTLKILEDPQIGVVTLAHIQSAIDWFEQTKQFDECRQLATALEATGERIDYDRASLTIKGMARKLTKRLDAIGKTVQISAESIRGKKISNASFADKIVVVICWSGKSKTSAAAIRKLGPIINLFRQRGVECLAVCVDEQYVEASQAKLNQSPTWTYIGGPREESTLMQMMPVSSVPQIYLVDHKGKIANIHVQIDSLANEIERLLQQKKNNPDG